LNNGWSNFLLKEYCALYKVDEDCSVYPKLLLRTFLNNVEEWLHKEDSRLEVDCIETYYFLLEKHSDTIKLEPELLLQMMIHILLSPIRFAYSIDRINEVHNLLKKMLRPTMPILKLLDNDKREWIMSNITEKIGFISDNPSELNMGKRIAVLESFQKIIFYNIIKDYIKPITKIYFTKATAIDLAYEQSMSELNNSSIDNNNFHAVSDFDEFLKDNSESSEGYTERKKTPKKRQRKKKQPKKEETTSTETKPEITNNTNNNNPNDSLEQNNQNQQQQETTSKKKNRTYWTTEEVDTLIKGVKKFGVGNWAVILRCYKNEFNEKRKAPDLKDKWRNVIAQKGKKPRKRKSSTPTPVTLTPFDDFIDTNK